MALKSLFASRKGGQGPAPTEFNRSGAPAYGYEARHKLVQIAASGMLGGGFYQSPEQELAAALKAAAAVEDGFLARTAIWARQEGRMKDMPALLLAVLSTRDPALFAKAFDWVIEDGRMLKTFVQIMRSGQAGRRSLGSRPKAMVAGWLNAASDGRIIAMAVGNDPSLADLIRLSRPKPGDAGRRALYAWAIGKPAEAALLPQPLQDWLAFKADPKGRPVPRAPFQMLTQLELTADQWGEVARTGSWQMVRQGLNMFLRKGAFADPVTVSIVADKLRDPEAIGKAMPYQVFAAAKAVSAEMPSAITEALYDAADIAVTRAPKIPGRVALCVDVSGSMSMPVSGYRGTASSAMRYVDVAGLFAAAILRANPGAEVLPFAHQLREARLSGRDTVLTNAERLAGLLGGGTDCALPLEDLAKRGAKVDLVVMLSDNESWIRPNGWQDPTRVMAAWEKIRARNPGARLACIDMAPYGTTQAQSREDVLNIGGFSDATFGLLAGFAEGRTGVDHWVSQIEAIDL